MAAYIEAAGSIEAGESIEVVRNIKAGEYVKATTYIDCGGSIFAGVSASLPSAKCDKSIICAELRQGEICYGELVITKNEASTAESE